MCDEDNTGKGEGDIAGREAVLLCQVFFVTGVKVYRLHNEIFVAMDGLVALCEPRRRHAWGCRDVRGRDDVRAAVHGESALFFKGCKVAKTVFLSF